MRNTVFNKKEGNVVERRNLVLDGGKENLVTLEYKSLDFPELSMEMTYFSHLGFVSFTLMNGSEELGTRFLYTNPDNDSKELLSKIFSYTYDLCEENKNYYIEKEPNFAAMFCSSLCNELNDMYHIYIANNIDPTKEAYVMEMESIKDISVDDVQRFIVFMNRDVNLYVITNVIKYVSLSDSVYHDSVVDNLNKIYKGFHGNVLKDLSDTRSKYKDDKDFDDVFTGAREISEFKGYFSEIFAILIKMRYRAWRNKTFIELANIFRDLYKMNIHNHRINVEIDFNIRHNDTLCNSSLVLYNLVSGSEPIDYGYEFDAIKFGIFHKDFSSMGNPNFAVCSVSIVDNDKTGKPEVRIKFENKLLGIRDEDNEVTVEFNLEKRFETETLVDVVSANISKYISSNDGIARKNKILSDILEGNDYKILKLKSALRNIIFYLLGNRKDFEWERKSLK